MTDREMLALAAKAAGIEARYSENIGDFSIGDPYSRDEARWNPLIDDADALRLAGNLSMSVDVDEHETSTYAYAGKVPRVYAMEIWHDDKNAATRRAIVRAAAEIGKAMATAEGSEG